MQQPRLKFKKIKSQFTLNMLNFGLDGQQRFRRRGGHLEGRTRQCLHDDLNLLQVLGRGALCGARLEGLPPAIASGHFAAFLTENRSTRVAPFGPLIRDPGLNGPAPRRLLSQIHSADKTIACELIFRLDRTSFDSRLVMEVEGTSWSRQLELIYLERRMRGRISASQAGILFVFPAPDHMIVRGRGWGEQLGRLTSVRTSTVHSTLFGAALFFS